MKATRKTSRSSSRNSSRKPEKKAAAKPLTANQQLDALVSKLENRQQALFRSIRNSLRRQFASSDELVYNYAHSLVISYSPTGRGIESPVTIATRDGGVRLYFNNGPKLPDPNKLLRGSGKQARFIWIESRKTLLLPEVKALMKEAVDLAKAPDRPGGRGTLVIK
jgi:hypothetical protein